MSPGSLANLARFCRIMGLVFSAGTFASVLFGLLRAWRATSTSNLSLAGRATVEVGENLAIGVPLCGLLLGASWWADRRGKRE